MENNLVDFLKKTKGLHKFGGVVPEGFIMLHENTLEDLKNFDIWKSWKNNEIKLTDLDVKNFDKNEKTL